MFPIAQLQHNMGQMITSTSARTVAKSALTKSAAAAAYCSVSLRRDFSATRDCVCESSMRRWIGWPRNEKTRSVSASAFVSTSSSNSSMEKRATKASGSHSDRKRNVINNNMNSSNQQQQQQQQQQRANQQKVRAVLEPEQSSQRRQDQQIAANNNNNNNDFNNDNQMKKRLTKSEREKNSKDYEWAALVSSCGVTSIAITATYFRLLRSYNLDDTAMFPTAELFAQLALIAGAAVGMEFYARFAHKYLWHDVWWSMPMKYRKPWTRKIWLLHESHHLPRDGAFEANDIFAVANGVPAFLLCAYGFFTPGVYGGLCFGAGLGITFFGIAYMYVHDGMVHKRFPTGPLGKMPWLRRVAAAHTIHHTEQFEGVPWGLFLSEQELSKHKGGIAELNKVCLANDRADKRRELECLASGKSADECDIPIELSIGTNINNMLMNNNNNSITISEGNDNNNNNNNSTVIIENNNFVESELGVRAGLHIPSQAQAPQCVITEDGRRE
jgi:beta-carotene 3-hydroxylase